MRGLVKTKRQAFASAVSGLDHLSPLKILGRGFAYVTDEQGQMLKSLSDYELDQDIHIHVADGQVGAHVTTKGENTWLNLLLKRNLHNWKTS